MIVKALRSAVLATVIGVTALVVTSCGTPSDPSDSAPTAPSAVDVDPATRAYLDETATALARQLGIVDPPEVTLVRLVTLSEWAPTRIACLQEAGFDVTETADGEGVQYPPIDDPTLRQSLNLAIYTCELKYPTQLKYMTPLSSEALTTLYAYRTGELVSCLEREGYRVQADPPSLAVFIQTNAGWSPFQDAAIAEADVKRIYAECPQTPESVYGQ